MQPVTYDFMETGAADVNGATFPQSVIMPSHGWLTVNKVSYNTERKMKWFRATIGVRDDSPPKSPIIFEVTADGRKVYSKSLRLGSSRKVDLNVKGVLRLDLVLRFPEAETDFQTSYHGVWGDAQFVRYRD